MLYRPTSVQTPREYPGGRRLFTFVLVVLVSIVIGTLGARFTTTIRQTDAQDHRPASPSSTRSPVPLLPTGSVNLSVLQQRDALAARPMPDNGTGHEYPYPNLSTRDPGAPIRLPRATKSDDIGVATGFPRTIPGAIAQLIAIDTTALGSASLPGVRAVITRWAVPGGPTTANWSDVKAMASMLASFGLSGAGSPTLRIAVTPAMAFVKGTVGQDFAVVCIDLALDIRGPVTTSGVTVDCQRMLWTGEHWAIGPGPEPAPAPSVWPDTDAAITAGYQDILQ